MNSKLEIKVSASSGLKCPRCWHWHNLRSTHDGLCDRCQRTLIENFPDHPSVPHIRASMQAERQRHCIRPADQACTHLHCCRNTEIFTKLKKMSDQIEFRNEP